MKPERDCTLDAGALAGLRVLDMTRVVAGPLAGQTLGDLGADVIKIERPGEGDDARRVGPPWMRDKDGNELEQSTYFQSVNRNKRSITVDFQQPEGAALIRNLAAKSDIFLENFRPGTLAKYGLGYEDLAQINPAIIYCAISGFGQTGPYSNRSGYDYLVQAMAGVMSVTGLPDGEPGGGPLRVGIPLADTFAGLQATIGVLAAVNYRNRTGKGQFIDISLFGSQLAGMLNTFSAWFNGGVEIGRTGNDHPSAAPYGVFPVEDGYILVATFNDREFSRLARLLGHPEWADDPRFAKNGARVQNRASLKVEVTNALKGKTKAEWVELLNAGTVSCGPINTIRELESDPHVLESGLIVALERPDHCIVRSPAAPFHLAESPPTYRYAPPAIGEHTDQVLRTILGLNEGQIHGLRECNII
jgi:crotonobetainyl-CoA:carnitine CoA-transferase CaiB-like acyl-CoA transferase